MWQSKTGAEYSGLACPGQTISPTVCPGPDDIYHRKNVLSLNRVDKAIISYIFTGNGPVVY